jgi:hypothetical protein
MMGAARRRRSSEPGEFSPGKHSLEQGLELDDRHCVIGRRQMGRSSESVIKGIGDPVCAERASEQWPFLTHSLLEASEL